MGHTGDGLRVIVSTLIPEDVPPGSCITVALEECLAAQRIALAHRSHNRFPRAQISQSHEPPRRQQRRPNLAVQLAGAVLQSTHPPAAHNPDERTAFPPRRDVQSSRAAQAALLFRSMFGESLLERMGNRLDAAEPRNLEFWVGTLILGSLVPLVVVSASALWAGSPTNTAVAGEAQLWLVGFSLIAASFCESFSTALSNQRRFVLSAASIVLLVIFVLPIASLTEFITRDPRTISLGDKVVSWIGVVSVIVGFLFARWTLKWTKKTEAE